MDMNLKNIKLNGRYYIDGDNLYFYNGGSGFSFKIKGNSFTVSINSMPIQGYFYIILDHDYSKKIKINTKKKNYKYVFKDKNPHLVDIVKANEANDNTFKVDKFEYDGELLAFDESYRGLVKVYGDSTIAGFGILEKIGIASVHNSDSVRDFCYHALYDLNFEMDIFTASGYGLAFSAYTTPKTKGIYNYLDRVAVNQNIKWDDGDLPDLLIISLGCNDNSYIQEATDKENRINEFKTKYRKLIDSQIKKNTRLPILMIYGTLNEESAYYLYEETYNYLKAFYKNLYIHKFKGDSSAISNHAYVDAHDRMAEELKRVIKEIL